MPSDLADLRADRDGLLLAAVYPTALADQRLVVVVPAGPRQVEHPPAFPPRSRGIGVRVEEDVPVIECGEQSDVLAEQHAVTEHVAAHVADADDGEVFGLGVDAHLAEVSFDGLPRAPGGDAHRLVVVAHRSAGGERVTKPEPVRLGDVVGDVGEGGGAFVRGHHQVGVVAVAPYHLGWRVDLFRCVVDVVGDVEQSGDEQLVAGDAFGADGVAVCGGRNLRAGRQRRPLDHEPPLAPTGTMTAFFTACALTRPRISVRKSSRRSDQRRPPRATGPNLRCTPSTRGEYTKISNLGRGNGSSSISCEFSLSANTLRARAEPSRVTK